MFMLKCADAKFKLRERRVLHKQSPIAVNFNCYKNVQLRSLSNDSDSQM